MVSQRAGAHLTRLSKFARLCGYESDHAQLSALYALSMPLAYRGLGLSSTLAQSI